MPTPGVQSLLSRRWTSLQNIPPQKPEAVTFYDSILQIAQYSQHQHQLIQKC